MAGRFFLFDRTYRRPGTFLAGVDEAGRGPLAGPVVAAAVILPERVRLPGLNDSKQLSSQQRERLYIQIQRQAVSIGVGIVSHEEIDRINIHQAGFEAMRLALSQLIHSPQHVLVDGFRIPKILLQQTAVLQGDARSASIAAASIVAKVTRDHLMRWQDRCHPGYGFASHKGYATRAHLEVLAVLGPCPIHRRTYAPVRNVTLLVS
jgi:ribonuclease HII